MNANEFHQARKFADTPFGRIAWVERGSGQPALLVHGFPLNGFQWRGVAEGLAGDRRCLMPDLMGLGYSEIAEGQDLSFTAQARMLASFLDALGVGAVDLVGNDSGAAICQVFAAHHPSRVRTLTLTNCEVHDLWPKPMLRALLDAFESGAAIQGIKAMLQDPAVARAQLESVYENPAIVTQEMLEVYYRPLVADDRPIRKFVGAEVNRAQLVASAPMLKQLTVPAQVIWGDGDTVFDGPASIDWLVANVPAIRRVTRIPLARLFFPEEHPRLLSVLLREFWNSTASKTTSGKQSVEMRPA
ncbi:MAG TPA: alpha/beta fold hydrolase [Candidatus Binataceae bacterium]